MRFFLLLIVFLASLAAAQPHHVLKVEADTFISGKDNGNYAHGHPDSTGDNYTLLVIKNEGEPLAGNSYYREVYLRFDLSSVDKPIEKVELKLWADAKEDTIEWTAYEDTLTYGSYLIEEDDWDENTMTWNEAPIPNFEKPLDVGPFLWRQDQIGEENGLGYHYYGWNKGGELDAGIVEAERTGDGKISLNVYGRKKKVWGETEKVWFAAVSKDSAQIAGRDMEPRLLIWVEGGAPAAVADDKQNPHQFELGPNYPNPFNPNTTIHYSLAADQPATMTIYNALGQPVRVMSNLPTGPGNHSVEWNGQMDAGQTAPSGVYFYKLQTGDNQAMRKMILMQ